MPAQHLTLRARCSPCGRWFAVDDGHLGDLVEAACPDCHSKPAEVEARSHDGSRFEISVWLRDDSSVIGDRVVWLR